jgi:hypothetical protein
MNAVGPLREIGRCSAAPGRAAIAPLELDADERAVLTEVLAQAVAADPAPFSPRVQALKRVLDVLTPPPSEPALLPPAGQAGEPARAEQPPRPASRRHRTSPSLQARRSRRRRERVLRNVFLGFLAICFLIPVGFSIYFSLPGQQPNKPSHAPATRTVPARPVPTATR